MLWMLDRRKLSVGNVNVVFLSYILCLLFTFMSVVVISVAGRYVRRLQATSDGPGQRSLNLTASALTVADETFPKQCPFSLICCNLWHIVFKQFISSVVF